ncbi:MAG: methylmalonyl-CoA mutase, partial [Rhodospirillaceae bacterium]|nr:methylmalonyl-CoA mutase [Rhodospirillaceae bacterium]
KYRSGEQAPVDILDIDNDKVRATQIARLAQLRAAREPAKVEAALSALTEAAAGEGNLLALSVEAMRARATVGEVSQALEKVFTRHRATTRAIAGVYGGAYDGDPEFRRIQQDAANFAEERGRRPRMLVVKLGQDGHDRGAKIIATAFADLGFDVDIGPLFQTPEEAARQAVENDVHVVGVSTQAAGHKTLVPQLIEALGAAGARDVLVICGGVIPLQDHDLLKQAGVAAVYGPGTNIPRAAADILALIRRQRVAA